MTLFDILRALAVDRRPGATIPQHHRAAAIFAPGDHALEIGIAHRMVFGSHRKALVGGIGARSEEHTSELQSLMRISYAVFCLKKKKQQTHIYIRHISKN